MATAYRIFRLFFQKFSDYGKKAAKPAESAANPMPQTPGFLPEFQAGMVKNPAFDTMPTYFIRKEGTALGPLQINETIALDSIVYCLVNAENNKEMLQDTPHIPFYDMAILFSSIVRDDEQQRNFMILSEALMKEHNFTLSQLSDLAHQNTFRMFPSRAKLLPLYLMSRVMQDDKATLDDYMEVAYASYESRKRPPMLRVSTPDYRYGSVAMLDTAYMDDIAKTFDSDLLLLPCSIREFLITPWTEDTNLSELVKSAKKIISTGTEPVLTRHVFCYNKNQKKLELVE